MKISRQARVWAVSLLALFLLAACGGETKPEPEAPDNSEPETVEPLNSEPAPPEEPEEPEEQNEQEPEPAAPNPLEAAMEQYRAIIGQADTYEFSLMEPNGVYRYTLLPMQEGCEVPALLLEQQTDFGIGYIGVFQYDPADETVHNPEDILMQGVGEAGGFRGSLAQAGDGNGVLTSEYSSGTGQGSTCRMTVDGDLLVRETLWEGIMFEDTDWTVEEIGWVDIPWYAIGDLALLDSWPDVPAPAEPEETNVPSLPSEEGRITVQGTVGVYDHYGVLELQQISEPNPGSMTDGETYWLIVLDTPQRMALRDIEGGFWEDEVTMIDVTRVEGIEQYEGQHVTISIDPANTDWPSDTRLPLGQPSTGDIHILE